MSLYQLTIEPGTRLIVGNFAKEFGISPSPVREGLRLLAKDGLAEIIPRRGAVTLVPTKKGFRSLFDIRRLLERLAVQKTVESLQPNQLRELEKIIAEAAKAIEKGDPALWCTKDDAFHYFFINNCDNHLLTQILTQLMDLVAYFRQVTFGAPVREEALAQHRAVLEHIQAGDTEGAAEAMVHHIDESYRIGIEKLNKKK